MLRKRIVKVLPSLSVPEPGEMDIAATARRAMTSEDPTHPIRHVFDNRRGPGGSRWVALKPGEQKRCCWRSTSQTIVEVEVEVSRAKPVVRVARWRTEHVSCAVKNITSARLAQPSSEKTGRCWLRE